MYTNTFRKIRPTLAAVLAGYTSLCSINIADAESGSTQVNVSATVVGPVEKEIKILDPQSSSPAQWEKAAPRSDNYTFEDDDYAWLDYTAPTTREATTAESDTFYEQADHYRKYTVARGSTLFRLWKNSYDGSLSFNQFLNEVKAENPQLKTLDKIGVGDELRVPSLD